MSARSEGSSSSSGSGGLWLRCGLGVAAAFTVAVVLWTSWDREAMMAWKQSAGPLPFFAVMAVLPALGIPITPFFIIAGASFGRRIGLLGSLLALGVNLVACYEIATHMRPGIESLMRRFRYPLPDFREREKGAMRFALAVKLAPGVPAFVKHYGLGVAGVPFGVYFGVAMLVTGTYAIALVLLGESLLRHRIDQALPLAALVVIALVAVWWRKRRKQVVTAPQHQPA